MGLLRGVARTAAVAGTATAVSNRVSRRQANRWDKKEQQQYAEQQAQQPAPPPQQAYAPAPEPVNTDVQFDQLQRLGDLKEQGIITQSEFDQKKRQLLGL